MADLSPPPLQMLPLTDCHFELYDQSDSKGLLLVDVCSSGVEMTHMNTVVNSVRFHKGWPVVVQQKKIVGDLESVLSFQIKTRLLLKI